MGAVTVLEHALCEGLRYLDLRHAAGRASFDATHELGLSRPLPEEIERGLEVHQVPFTTGAGTLLLFQFDAKDGRLLEIAQPEVPPAWFVRFGRRKKFGTLWLPALGVAGRFDARAKPDLDVFEIDEVRIVPRHPEAFFAGSPEQPLLRAADGGPLRLLPHTVAGMAHVAATETRVGRQPGVVMLVDTGADTCSVTAGLAQAQRMLLLGRQRLMTADRSGRAARGRLAGKLPDTMLANARAAIRPTSAGLCPARSRHSPGHRAARSASAHCERDHVPP